MINFIVCILFYFAYVIFPFILLLTILIAIFYSIRFDHIVDKRCILTEAIYEFNVYCITNDINFIIDYDEIKDVDEASRIKKIKISYEDLISKKTLDILLPYIEIVEKERKENNIMQKFKFMMETLRITQGYGRNSDGSVNYSSFSHAGSYALDLGGESGATNSWMYAPCDIVVKRHYRGLSGYNAVWFETINEVMCADGIARKLVLLCIHANDNVISELGIAVGKTFNQGDKFYREGSGGGVNSHVHIEVGLAPFTEGGWYESDYIDNSNGKNVWIINNKLIPNEVFVVGDDVVISNDGGYSWTRESEINKPEVKAMRLKIGFASSGDIWTIEKKLEELCISDYTEKDGYIVTNISLSAGDVLTMQNLCSSLGVPCVEYIEEEESCEELKAKIKELNGEIFELEKENKFLTEKINNVISILNS